MLNFIIFLQGLVILSLCVNILVLWSRQRVNGGKIVITQNEDGKKLFSLELDKDPDEIEQMSYISFKVIDSQQ